MGGADGNGQGVAAGLGDELLHFLRTGIGGSLGRDIDLVLNAGQRAQLSLNNDTVVMSVLNDLLGDLNVLLEGLGRGVDHDGGKTAIDAGLAGFEAIAMVQVQDDGDIGALNDSSLDQLHQVGMVGIGAGALGDLQNHGSLFLAAGLGDCLYDLHIVDVESADA